MKVSKEATIIQRLAVHRRVDMPKPQASNFWVEVVVMTKGHSLIKDFM